jgi:predicted O-methyltransferase YrrM
MNSTLADALATGVVTDDAGRTHQLRDHICADEGAFLAGLLDEDQVTRALEVGCAMGISAMYICDAMAKRTSSRHVVIDAFQSTTWHNTGISNLRRAGHDFVELIEELSEVALPRMMAAGERFEFALIDGMHTFDHTLIDFFYINRMLDVGGVVVFDDTQLPPVAKVVRYVLNYPGYELAGVVGDVSTWKRRLLDGAKRGLGAITPELFKREFLCPSTYAAQEPINPYASMVALRKTAEDDRSWNWYEPF